MAWIRNKNGQQLCEVKKLSYNGVFMDVASITVTVESAAPIDFSIGDYIEWDYDGLRYTLDTAAGVEKVARRNTIGNAFVYENLVFLSPLKAADNVDFLDVILGNTVDFLTNTEFSFYGTAWDYAKRLEANLCRLYGSGSWKVRIWTNGVCYDTTPATLDTGSWESKLVDVSKIKCLGGFRQIYDLWGCAYVFSVENGVNYVDFYDDFEQYAQTWKQGGIDKIFAYGKGNGLYKIRHTPDADHVLVTRLRAYGSSENLPANYYLNSPDYHVDGNESSELAIANLMLPASEWTKDGVKRPANAYLEQNTDLYGVREGTVAWDGSDEELGEIKPSIYGLTIQDLLDLMSSGDSYRPVEAKWPDTSQRIDKIITGAAPTDNGAVAESGYDFTVVESSGSFAVHSFGASKAVVEVDFSDLVMGTTPAVSNLAEYRIVPTGSNEKVVSFDVTNETALAIRSVTAYLTPYVGGVKIENATFPCTISQEAITNEVSGVVYKRRYFIHLRDSAGSAIVFSTMLTGTVTFRFFANVEFNSSSIDQFSVVRNEYAVSFNLLRGNKSIDKFFSVVIPQIGFDLAGAVTGNAKLCMRSGANQPREFQIVPSSVRYDANTDRWYLRCKRSLDQSTKTYFPNSDAVIATGDEYYFSGIAMPTLYVEIAANKLKTAAQAWLSKHSKPRMLSSVDVDNKIMAVEGIVLKEGMSLPLSDVDLGITPQNQESRVIDNIRIEEGSASIRTFTITLRDKKEKSSIDAAIRGATSNFATNSSVSDAIEAAESKDHATLSGRDMPNQHPISAITGLEKALASFSFFEEDGQGGIKLKEEYAGLRTKGYLIGASDGGPGGGGGGGLIERLWRVGDLSDDVTDFDNTANDTFNAYTINSLHTRILALEENPGGVSSVAGLTGAVSASDLFTALGLGTAATRAVGAIENANTGLVTGGDVYSFVNSSVATATATFRGTNTTATTEASFLAWADGLTHDLNDYVFWATTDAYGNTVYKRYKYDGASWVFEYNLNNSSFTAAQWAAINSGITYQKITGYDTVAAYFTNGVLGTDNIPQIPTSKITGLDTTLTSISASITALEKMFIDDTYTVDGQIKHRIKVNSTYFDGLITTGFLIGAADGGPGGGGGGGIDLNLMWASLQNTTPDTHATDKFHKNHLPAIVAADGISAGYTLDSGNLATHLNIGISAINMSKVSGLSTALAGKADASALAGYLSLSGGAMNNTNVVTNLNADLLDGRNETGFLRRQELERSGQYYDANDLTQADTHYTTNGDRTNVHGWSNFPDSTLSGPFGLIHLKDGSYPVQLFHNYSEPNFWIRYSLFMASSIVWSDWAKIWTSANFVAGVNYQAPLSQGTGITISNNTVSVTANTYAPYNSAGYLPLSGGTMSNTNLVTNLNADLLDGQQGSYYAAASSLANYLPLSGGTMSNTTVVTNLNADLLDGYHITSFLRRVNLSGNTFNANNMTDDMVVYSQQNEVRGTTITNGPPGVSYNGSFSLISFLMGDQYHWQILMPYGSADGPYFRRQDYNGGVVWKDWGKLYHSGNSNLTTVPWSASSLTLAGAISGATNIDSLLYFDTTNSRVGIGAAPSYKFDVAGTACFGGTGIGDALIIRCSSNGVDAYYIGSLNANSSTMRIINFSGTTSHITLDQYGHIGIMNTSPQYALDVSGAIHSTTGVISPGYGVFAASASSSDARLKDGIVSISPKRAWSVLMQLKPREWTWNANYYQAGKRGAGLVAQEVEPVLPFSVLNEDKYLHLTYDVMHGFEIAGLQDHETRLRKQETMLEQAEKRIAVLEAENSELKARLNN